MAYVERRVIVVPRSETDQELARIPLDGISPDVRPVMNISNPTFAKLDLKYSSSKTNVDPAKASGAMIVKVGLPFDGKTITVNNVSKKGGDGNL